MPQSLWESEKNRVDGDPCFFLVSNIITPFYFFSFKGGSENIFVTDRLYAVLLALDERENAGGAPECA
jgi:hypothetical protein